MSHCNDNDEDEAILDTETLEENIGRIITVFTQSGGCSGRGFTGLLVRVDPRFIKLITSFPSAPRHPFGIRSFDFDDFHCNCSRFSTAIVIPRRKIVSYVFNEV